MPLSRSTTSAAPHRHHVAPTTRRGRHTPCPGDRADSVLIRAVRSGDMGAAEALYVRHHEAVLRAARRISNPGVAEDLTAEAFAKVVAALVAGRGPDHALRAYLVMTVRHLFIDSLRKGAREVLVDDDEGALDRTQPDAADHVVERSVLLEVLAELPARWREVLWRSIVLEEPLAAVAATMGLSPNAAAQLSFRARAGLGKAYRQRFASGSEEPPRVLAGAPV